MYPALNYREFLITFTVILGTRWRQQMAQIDGEDCLYHGPPVHELSPVTSHTSMIPCLPVHGCLQKDTAMPNILGPDILEGPPHYPDYHLPQYAPRETEIQMHHEPTKTSTPQRCPNPLFHPGNSMQPSLQWFPDPERNLGPQVSPELSMTPSLPMNASLPALGTQIVSQMQQMSLCSSGSPDSEGSIGPMMPSSKYGNEQDHPEPPSKQRKERTVFSKEQKLILQEHFDHCKYPSFNQRTDLALIVGVTEYVIMIWFKNQRAKYKRMNPKSSKEELQESAGNAEDLSPSNDYDGAVKEKEV